jgi:hypothetical protein
MRAMMPVLMAVTIAACGGPGEKTGETVDATTAETAAAPAVGPNERVGQGIDRARAAAENSGGAGADLVRDEADARDDALDRQADRLEDQGNALRRQADQAGPSQDGVGQPR